MKTKFIKNLMIKYSGSGFILLSVLLVLVLLAKAYQRVGIAERDDILKLVELGLDNGLKTRFHLNQAEGKPEILNADNYPILKYSDQDSTLIIDTQTYKLWDLIFNYKVDSRNKELAYTRSTAEDKLKKAYTLEQTQKLLDKNTIEISFYFVWTAPENVSASVRDVQLQLAHFNPGVSGLGEENQQIRGQTQIFSRRPTNGSTTFYVPFELSTSGLTNSPDLNFHKADSSEQSGFITNYKIDNPEKGKRTLIAKETIKLGNTYPK